MGGNQHPYCNYQTKAGMNINRTLSFQAPFMPYLIDYGHRLFDQDELHVSRVFHEHVLIMMLRNELRFVEDGEPIIVKGGQWYIQAPLLRQDARFASPAAEYYYIHFNPISPHVLPDSTTIHSTLHMPVRGNFIMPSLLPLLTEMESLSHLAHDSYRKQVIFHNIMHKLMASTFVPQEPSTQLAEQIMNYLNEHYRTMGSCHILEDVFHYSSTYIANLLKKHYQITPWKYVQRIRIEEAAKLLTHTNDTIADICQTVGYNDLSVFYKSFKKQMQKSPQEWREISRL